MNITEQTTIYIAGPMSGHFLLNYPAFFAMEGILKKEFKCNVLNPARQPNGLPYEEYMKRAMEDLEKADAIVLLNGWTNSTGAAREMKKASENHLDVFLEDEICREINRKLKAENPEISIRDGKQ